MEILKESSPKWEEEYLLKLRFEIDSIKAYDEAQLEKVPEVDAAISELNELIAPKSFHERLLQVVGQWDPASQSVDVDNRLDVQRELDRELASEGLSLPYPIFSQLDWLEVKGLFVLQSSWSKWVHWIMATCC